MRTSNQANRGESHFLLVCADDPSWISAPTTALDRPLPAGHLEDLSRCGSTVPKAETPTRGFVSIAFSWLLNCTIEEFTAYAEATCPIRWELDTPTRPAAMLSHHVSPIALRTGAKYE